MGNRADRQCPERRLMGTARASGAVLAVWALACALAHSDDTRTPQAADPDPGFLEFLGSVDRLAEVNPDYLARAAPPRGGGGGRGRPPRPPPPPPRGAGGVKNNENPPAPLHRPAAACGSPRVCAASARRCAASPHRCAASAC